MKFKAKFQHNNNHICILIPNLCSNPIYKAVHENFTKDHLVYDKFSSNMDGNLFNMNIYSIERLKNLKNNDYLINK